MTDGLPQPSPSRPRGRLTTIGAALSLTLALVPAPRGSRAQGAEADAPRAPRACTIEGRASFREVRVRRPGRRRRATTAIVPIEDRLVAVQALTPSLLLVRTPAGEPEIEGETREPVSILLRHAVTLSGVVLGEGAPIRRFSPRDESLEADVDLGDGVVAHHVVLPCEALRVRPPSGPGAVVRPALAHPRWRARTGTLRVRQHADEGIEALLVTVPSFLELHELARTEAFVRVSLVLPHGGIDGWVRDHDLVR
ncbi:MAG: hypothetical protein OHK0013_45500 [Sandaracinaceae bacterium]